MEGIARHLVFVLVVLGFSPTVYADELLGPVNDQDQGPWRVGAGVIYREQPYDDFDDGEKAQVLPLVLFEGERFYVRGASLGWKFVDQDDFTFSLQGEFRAQGYESSDSDALSGMDDRDPTLDGGLNVAWRPGGGKLSLDFVAVHDLTDEYDGYELRAGAGYRTPVGPVAMKFGAHVVYQSDDLVDHYYGVRASEARLGRPAYSPDGETNFRLQALGAYKLGKSDKWTLYGGGRFEFLGDEISDSPIVSEDTFWMALVGFTYTFGG